MTLLKPIALAAAVALAPSVSGAASIMNGGFESPGTFSGSFQNTSSLDGWSVTGNVDLINNYWQNATGSYSLDLNGTSSSASISQTVTGLTVGTVYEILFALSGNPVGAPQVKMLNVSVDGTSQNYTYDVTGNNVSNMNWQTQSFLFTAAATSTLLTFASTQSATSFGPALDDISIAEYGTASPIPIPAAGFLLLGGLAALGAMRLRKAG